MKKVFVSNSSKDKEIVDLFISEILISALRFNQDDIYCSSVGLGTKSGDDFIKGIKETVSNSKITILIVTSNYKNSEICLNEMGASWVSNSRVIPLVLDPVTFNDVGPLNISTQCEKLLDKKSLLKIAEVIRSDLGNDFSVSYLDNKIDSFIKKAQLIDIPAPQAVNYEEFIKLEKELQVRKKDFKELFEENEKLSAYVQQLEQLKDKEDIKEAKSNSGFYDYSNEFSSHITAVKKVLKNFNSVTGFILLCRYYQQPVPHVENYHIPDLEEGIRKGHLYDDHESVIANTDNKFVKNLYKHLEDLDDCDEEFLSWYKDEYDDDYRPSNQDFWESFYKVIWSK